MKRMTDSVSLGRLKIKNRLIRSATLEIGGAENGRITPLLGRVYRELTAGGVGLIITGMMGVAPDGGLFPGMARIYDDSFGERFGEVAEAVHRGGGRVVVQLGHCGARAHDLDGGGPAPAPADAETSGAPARALSKEQIGGLVKAYGAAARACRAAGADGVQIHAAHGYLLSQFLSPLFNRRTDEYGGDVHGRARILFEIYDEIRRTAGEDCPVLVKINHSDLADGGFSEVDFRWCGRELDRRGIDAIEISAGIGLDEVSSFIQGGRTDQAFNAAPALRLAEEVKATVVSVGGFRSPEAIERALNGGRIAAVALCRALIREPDLPGRWLAGRRDDSACLACGGCLKSREHGCFLDQG